MNKHNTGKQQIPTSLSLQMHEYKIQQISYNHNEPICYNETMTLFEGNCENIGKVTLLPLFNYSLNQENFRSLLASVNFSLEVKSSFLLKILGYVITQSFFMFIFEPIDMTLETKMLQVTISPEEKYSIIFDIMELILNFQDANYLLPNIKPSNILLTEKGEAKIIFPFANMFEFNRKKSIADEKDINEEIFIRYNPPERLDKPPLTGKVNVIWMLGCLMIELFSNIKVWEGYSELEMVSKLKSKSIPIVPSKLTEEAIWGMLCECINPYHKTRIEIKELFIRYYDVIKRHCPVLLNRFYPIKSRFDISFNDIPTWYNGDNQTIPPISRKESLLTNNNEHNYNLNRCYRHPKLILDSICLICHDCLCQNCINEENHNDHNESIISIKSYIKDTIKYMNTFKSKFTSFINDDNLKHPLEGSETFLLGQRNTINSLTNNHLKYIDAQFDLFHQRVDLLKQIEIDNIERHHQYFMEQLDVFELTINNLIKERNRIENEIEDKTSTLMNFASLEEYVKYNIVKNIPFDKTTLKDNKERIIAAVKGYQKDFKACERIQQFYNYTINNFEEGKSTQFISALGKLINQLKEQPVKTKENLDSYYYDYLIDLDSIALINSRNYLPKNINEIFVACSKTNKVLSYNILTTNFLKTEADFSEIDSLDYFPNFARSLNIDGKLYINGGYDEKKDKDYNIHMVYDSSTSKLRRLANMFTGHYAHSIIYIPNNFIYVISGSNTYKTEKYNLLNNKWEEMPEVNYQRQNCSIAYNNEMFLYIFGGLYYDKNVNSYVFVETVERIDIRFNKGDKLNHWEIIQSMKMNKSIVLSKSVMTVIPVTSNQILLIGGTNENNEYSDDVIIYDYNNNEFKRNDKIKMIKPACFPTKSFLFKGDYGYQFDNEGDVHEYSIKEGSFRLITPLKK